MKGKEGKKKNLLPVPADLRKALGENVRAKEKWEGITPKARRDWIIALVLTNNPETRKRRLDKTISMLSSGKGRICCFPGINWLLKVQKESGKRDKKLEAIAKKLNIK